MKTISEELCSDCEDGLEHCHGVVIRHAGGSFVCVEDPDCPVPEPGHHFATDCAEPGCCPDYRLDRRRAGPGASRSAATARQPLGIPTAASA